MTQHIYNTPLNDPLSFDDDDVFQCGRCKKQFRSLDVFIQHKREDCSSTTVQFRNGSEKHTVIDISSPFLEPGSDTTSVNFGDTQNHVLATMSVSSENTPALVNNGMSNSSVLHLTPSMMLTDDSLSFTIPVAQHSSLTHIVAHGHNSSQQVLSVSESDLNNLINSSERFHLSSIDQIHNPQISSHGLLLTASLISSGKDSNIHLLSNIPSHIQSNGSSNDRCHQNSDTAASSPLACSMESQLESISMDVTSRDSQIDEHNLESITVQVVHEPDICNSELVKHGTVLSDSVIDKIVEIVTICTDSDNENTIDDKKKCRTTKGLRGDSESSLSTSRKCEYCGKVFKKVFNLHQHIRSHTGEKPFHCLVCGRGFTQKSNVKKHMQTHKVWPKMKVTLPKEQISVKVKNAQNAEVPTEGSLADISQVEYIVNNVYVCQYCGELFENHHKLKTHMIVHKSEKLFKCNHKDCAATFLEVEGLISHIKNHEDEMEYRCQQCTKVFNNLYDLGAHQYTHRLYPNKISTGVSRSHRCVKCNNKYSSSEALNHHLLTSSHYYPCSQCGLVFVCERYLRRHLKIHSSGEPFQCTQCGKSFKTENYLKSHLVIHSDSKPFNCETCGALFNRRDKLTRHKRIHESRKKFKCPFKPTTGCTREFYRKDKLKDHLLSHSRKTYVCAKCGKSFSWPTKLRHHQVEHHPEMLASTTCNQCHRIFKTKHHLKIHLCKGAIMESGKRAKASNRKGNVSSKIKVNNVRPSFKESCDLEDEEDVMYGDCDIMVKNETGDREESAILVGLTNVGSDHAREILTQYSDSEANEDDGNGVLSTMEIGFETSVGSSSMDPLMAGD